MHIDVFQYIASNEPRQAAKVIRNFGYECRSADMAQNLRELVENEGDAAVHDIMLIHPDLEYFSKSMSSKDKLIKKKYDVLDREKYAYLNAIGSNQNQQSHSHAISTQTNVFIFVGAMLLAAAIITKK